MIGIGAGIAPFRGILQELALDPMEKDVILIYGIRTDPTHFIFKNDFERFAAKSDLELEYLYEYETEARIPVLSQFFVAISRYEPYIHIQDVLQANLSHF